MSYKVLSTKIDGNLLFQNIFNDAKLHNNIRIMSAYYDISKLEELLDLKSTRRAKKIHTVQIILNGLSGARLVEQVSDLQKLKDKIKLRYKNAKNKIEIKLCTQDGIFHPKLIILDSSIKEDCIVYVGSANLTEAAYSKNEEIMIRIFGKNKKFYDYFNKAWDSNNSISVSSIPSKQIAKTLINLFRQGLLYFKPQISLQKTYNPFLDLLKAMPPDIRGKLEALNVPHADISGDIGAFSFEKVVNIESYKKEKTNKIPINTYAIETCLGYWVPKCYHKQIDRLCDNSSNKKYNSLIKLRENLNNQSEDFYKNAYSEYLSSIKKFFHDNGIDYIKIIKASKVRIENPFESEDKMLSTLSNIKNRLERDEFIKKYSRPYSYSQMPEIWDDVVSVDHFCQSFFEYLEYASHGNSMPKIVRNFSKKLNDYDCESYKAKNYKSLVEKYLKEKGWHEDDWIE